MRAAATLFWQSFTGTRLSTVLSLTGLVLLVAGCISQLIVPTWTLGNGMNRQMSLVTQALMTTAPWLAVLTLFLATSAQPRVVRGLVFGPASASLPNVRRNVLFGVVSVAAVVSLAAATPAMLFFVDYPIEVDLAAVFTRSFVTAFVNFGLLYLAFLALAYLRGFWFFVGPVLILVAIAVPISVIGAPSEWLGWPLLAGTVGWLAYGSLILAGDRLVAVAARWRGAWGRTSAPVGIAATPAPAAAVTRVLGTDRPWMLALAQCLPIVLAFFFAPDRGPVLFGIALFSLVIFSALNGARSMFAAPRSRALWLRSDATLGQLFHQAETSCLHQAGIALVVAMLLLIGVGTVTQIPALLVVIGLALLALAMVSGLYLGLAMTRGLPPVDALLAAVTMSLVVIPTVLSIRGERLSLAVFLAGGLLTMTLGLRFLARARWSRLDWMRCRLP